MQCQKLSDDSLLANESKQKSREYFDEKISAEIEETERVKNQLEQLTQEYERLDSEYADIRQQLEQALNDRQTFEEQLREKNEVLEYVSEEVNKIRDQSGDAQ